ncbi:MAG: carboxylesterase/lipase family protein [Promethearchaeota archaeon]
MDLIINTKLGRIKGLQKEAYQEFLGIRYAKAPIGELRFQQPQQLEPWEEIYDATKYGSIAPQLWEDNPPIKLEESEDCLFLNIYTPQADDNKRPVMFYIHGGAFAIGSGSRPRLYGGNLVKHGNVVVVTIQYRLGALGFLYMDNVSPNLGLQDQVCALKWVRDNIDAFGGDPNNITVFGQSAGAQSVLYLLLMPQAKGLFHKAIAQSGSIPLDFGISRNYVNSTPKLLSKLKIQPGNLRALKDLPLEQLMNAQKKIQKGILSEMTFYPVMDGKVVPKNVPGVLKTGFAKDIPLIIGNTADELPLFGYYLKSSWRLKRFLVKILFNRRFQRLGLKKSAIKEILNAYRKNLEKTGVVPNKEYDIFITDLMFRIPAIKFAEAHSSSNSNTYFYIFTYPAPRIGSAVHVLDLFFVFNTLKTIDIAEDMQLSGSKEEEHLSKTIMDTWASFAQTGNPNHSGLPEWPTYNIQKRSTMILDVSSKVVEAPMDEERKIWEEIV